MRLDVCLCDRGLCASRTEAKEHILAGLVCVNGKQVNKPAYSISDTDLIEIVGEARKYVSRGGLKLEGALENFSICAEGALALDVGASSGGFTDCLLKHGAAHVIAVDSGSDQLCDVVRNDKRVSSIENYNARFLKAEDLEYAPSLAVMDVSFISATLIMPAVRETLAEGGDFICLIKPQFEVGKSGLGKGGIVKSDKIRAAAVNGVIDFARNIGFSLVALKQSPIIGGDGNIEYLAHFKNGGTE